MNTIKPLLHPDCKDFKLASILYALSDPIRLDIVSQIRSQGPQACNCFEMPIAKSTLSHHLRTLREAGVTRTQIDGTRRIMSVRTEDLDLMFPGLIDTIFTAYSLHKEQN